MVKRGKRGKMAWQNYFSLTNTVNFRRLLQLLLLIYIRLKIHRLPNFNMLFQHVLTKFFEIELGPVVRTPVSANPGLNFNPAFFFMLSKALSWIIFAILFRVSNYQIVGKEN